MSGPAGMTKWGEFDPETLLELPRWERHRWMDSVRGLSLAQRVVLHELMSAANEHGVSWRSQAKLAETIEVSTRTVLRALADLESRGLIRRFPRMFTTGPRSGQRTSDVIVIGCHIPSSDPGDRESVDYQSSGDRESVDHGDRESQQSYSNTRTTKNKTTSTIESNGHDDSSVIDDSSVVDDPSLDASQVVDEPSTPQATPSTHQQDKTNTECCPVHTLDYVRLRDVINHNGNWWERIMPPQWYEPCNTPAACLARHIEIRSAIAREVAPRPPSASSLKQAELFLRRDSEGVDDMGNPIPVDFGRAMTLIDAMHAHRLRNLGAFSWAEQIRSANKFRQKFPDVRLAMRKARQVESGQVTDGRRQGPAVYHPPVFDSAAEIVEDDGPVPVLDPELEGLSGAELARAAVALRRRRAASEAVAP